tara:strand:+ start:4454 stop:5413 length:960 start_codon:yes stop_codon:yes gene_type:complete
MATTLIDTRKSILSQIHTSWNEFRSTDEAMVLMFGEIGQNYRDYHEIPLAENFTKSDTPWTTNQSVLEKNAVHANKLIRLYISLNIDISERMHIWEFFETGNSVVGKIKYHISNLKRTVKMLKIQQLQTDKEDQKEAKKLAKEEAKVKKIALKAYKQVAKIRAKATVKAEKAQAKAIAKEAEKRKKLLAKIDAKYPSIHFDREGCSIEYIKKILKDIPSLIAADKEYDRRTKKEEKERAKKEEKERAKKAVKAEKTKAKERTLKRVQQLKLGKKLAKKTLALLKWAQDNDFTKDDIVNELELQVKDSRSDNMVTIIDIA